MRLTALATAALGSVAALLGFSGAAHASATVDLIWIDVSQTNAAGNPICLQPANRNCAPDPRSPDGGLTISGLAVSDSITLGVILTAGPNGSIGGGVSVNYADALPELGVTAFKSLTTTQPLAYLPLNLGSTTIQTPYINNINAASAPPLGQGIGLPAGVSAYLGTVSFHKNLVGNGTFEIIVGTDGPGGTDNVLDGVGNTITGTTTFNSAYVIDSSGEPPRCDDGAGTPVDMEIEVNALRGGAKTVSAGPNQSRDVTAKARILKGTAVAGTTIDTTLVIQAEDAMGVMDTKTSFPITLGVGKGGQGDKLNMAIPRCIGGFVSFHATFFGTDHNGDLCEGERRISKACR